MQQPMDDVYKEYAQMVFKYLMSLCHDSDLAEELTQETFFQAVRSIEKFDGSCKISTWLCAIAKNVLQAHRRKQKPLEEIKDPQKTSDSAEKETLDKYDQIELMKQLHRCPEPFKEILYLRIFGGMSFKDIGDIMGKTENWARVNFYRGKEHLRKELEADEVSITL